MKMILDIFANVDVSNQPLLAANRIVSNTYMPIFIKSTNINNEPMETITSYTISSVTNDILNGTKIVTSNPDGVAEFNMGCLICMGWKFSSNELC